MCLSVNPDYPLAVITFSKLKIHKADLKLLKTEHKIIKTELLLLKTEMKKLNLNSSTEN